MPISIHQHPIVVELRRHIFLLLVTIVALSTTARAQVGHSHGAGPQERPHPLCGTMAWMAEEAGIHDPKRPSIQAITCDNRPTKERNVLSGEGRFRIHFDLSGRDSVSIVDRDANGVPDYVDSAAIFLEQSWDLEIDEFKFDAPPLDNKGMGPEIDVYLCDLNGFYYGLAVPERDLPTGPNTVMGFLVMDNDFSEEQGYPTTGFDGLKVTCAHEFHHIVQFSRYRYDFGQAALYEATSVWFERKFAPHVDDFLTYVQPFLQAPQTIGFSTHNVQETVTGYAHVLYMEYLEKKIDRDIVRRIWERFKNEPIAFDAIDQALRESDHNLENSYCEFAEWCYYTGARSIEGRYFEEARILKTMLPAQVRPFSGDDLLVQDKLFPLSFGIYRVTAPRGTSGNRDTIDFLITNAHTNFGRGGPTIPKDSFTLEVVDAPRDDYRALPHGNDTLYFKLRSSHPQFCVNPLIGGRAINFLATTISPQPFLSDGAARLIFGVDLAREEVHRVKLWIYSSALVRVGEVVQNELMAQDNQLGVIWDGRDVHGDLVPSGIYIFELSINDDSPIIGKFAVIRK